MQPTPVLKLPTVEEFLLNLIVYQYDGLNAAEAGFKNFSQEHYRRFVSEIRDCEAEPDGKQKLGRFVSESHIPIVFDTYDSAHDYINHFAELAESRLA